jgi:aflatoxin B1 aldehyde reductase
MFYYFIILFLWPQKNREKEVSVVLGTMTFGGQTDEETSLQMVQEFLARGHRELDTAFLYQNGHTEEILGRILAKERQERGDSGIAPYVATKVNPWGYSGRSLKPADVKKQASPPHSHHVCSLVRF